MMRSLSEDMTIKRSLVNSEKEPVLPTRVRPMLPRKFERNRLSVPARTPTISPRGATLLRLWRPAAPPLLRARGVALPEGGRSGDRLRLPVEAPFVLVRRYRSAAREDPRVPGTVAQIYRFSS